MDLPYSFLQLQQIHPFLLLSLLLHVLILSLLRRRHRSSSSSNPKLPPPPSPPGLPVIGNLHQLGSLPHRSLATLAARHGPIMLLKLGQVPTLVVSSVDMAREVMKHQDHMFASRPSLTVPSMLLRDGHDVAFAPYGEYWRQVKKVSLLHLLSAKMVRSFRAIREEEVALMIGDISRTSSSGAPVNMTATVKYLAKHVISGATLGRSSKKERWGGYIDDVMEEASEMMGSFYVADCFPSLPWLGKLTGLETRVKKVLDVLDPILDEIMEKHTNRSRQVAAEHGETDFVHILLSLKEDPDMNAFISKETIKSMVMDMYAAGMDSTHIAIEWAMAELVRNPGVMKKLQDEVRAVVGSKLVVEEEDLSRMEYLKAVIKEAMRLHPPGPLLVPRELIEETTIQGYRIPKGARTLINVWAIGRDPKTWPEATEKFWPERFVGSPIDYKGQHFELTPFGAGRRICPGIGFAVAVIEIGLANLVHRFDWKLPAADGMEEEQMDMGETFGITLRMKSGLRLVATPRF